MTMEEKKVQVAVAMRAAVAVAEVIREAGAIPSGELYARLMGKLNIESYEMLIESLIKSELIRRERSHLLVWIGPEKVN